LQLHKSPVDSDVIRINFKYFFIFVCFRLMIILFFYPAVVR
jgi:hypothetical protein